jgi:hypothetical protein
MTFWIRSRNSGLRIQGSGYEGNNYVSTTLVLMFYRTRRRCASNTKEKRNSAKNMNRFQPGARFEQNFSRWNSSPVFNSSVVSIFMNPKVLANCLGLNLGLVCGCSSFQKAKTLHAFSTKSLSLNIKTKFICQPGLFVVHACILLVWPDTIR